MKKLKPLSKALFTPPHSSITIIFFAFSLTAEELQAKKLGISYWAYRTTYTSPLYTLTLTNPGFRQFQEGKYSEGRT